MSDLKQYMINRRDALLEINEFNMANEFEIMLEDFAEQLSIPSSAEERYREALDHCLTGGNSLSSAIIGWMLPAGYEKWSKEEAISYFYDRFDRDEAYEKYEIWLCWKSIMEARDMVEVLSPSGEQKEDGE